MGLVDGKVALVTGAGRGQGRSHALKLASEGADVIAVDIGGGQVDTISYELASEADLDTTVSEIEAMGRRAVKAIADVRSLSDLQARGRPRSVRAREDRHRLRQRRHRLLGGRAGR